MVKRKNKIYPVMSFYLQRYFSTYRSCLKKCWLIGWLPLQVEVFLKVSPEKPHTCLWFLAPLMLPLLFPEHHSKFRVAAWPSCVLLSLGPHRGSPPPPDMSKESGIQAQEAFWASAKNCEWRPLLIAGFSSPGGAGTVLLCARGFLPLLPQASSLPSARGCKTRSWAVPTQISRAIQTSLTSALSISKSYSRIVETQPS